MAPPLGLYCSIRPHARLIWTRLVSAFHLHDESSNRRSEQQTRGRAGEVRHMVDADNSTAGRHACLFENLPKRKFSQYGRLHHLAPIEATPRQPCDHADSE
uniref:Uncharacterized protein n=1 Tax=Calcidiscus leptoporus TaxID=127549 RepID=A0A7S0NQS6_9EUKA